MSTSPGHGSSATLDDMQRLLDREVPGVDVEISATERMPLTHPQYYFRVGQSAIRLIRLALLAAGKTEVRSILDLPSGHGRVLRYLKVAFPGAELTACDILRDGVDFCAARFGATPVYSDLIPSAAMFSARRFDLIFCGSLLTHVDAPRWGDFLALFDALLEPGGVLVFTVHGPFVAYRMRAGEHYGYGAARRRGLARFLSSLIGWEDGPSRIARLLRGYDSDGFGYLDDGSGTYGITLSKPSWVLTQVEHHPDLRMLAYLERGWDDHQDGVVCMKHPFVSPAVHA